MLTPRDRVILSKALEIVESANSKNLVLRIIGALGIFLHIRDNSEALRFYFSQHRLTGLQGFFTDIDLVAYSKQKKRLRDFFEKDLKLETNPRLLIVFSGKRLFYIERTADVKIDVFFDKLEFSHDVVLGDEPGKGRLELDYPAVTPTDLLLTKLQIHNINFKDLVDIISLLIAHEVEKLEIKNTINGLYIAEILSNDWGFWFDAVANIKKALELAKSQLEEGRIEENIYNTVSTRANMLLKLIDETPKTKNWEKRAKIGTKKPWYREVEEVM